MKINISNKIFITIIFVVILVIIFLSFVVIQNTFSGKPPLLIYLLLILLLFTTSVLYYITFSSYRSDKESIEVSEDDEHPVNSSNSIDEITVDESVVENTIDIRKILPKEKTNPEKFAEEMLQNLASEYQISQGLFYIRSTTDDLFNCFARYAYYSDKPPTSFKIGETLSGQAVKNKNIVTLSDIPEKYMTIASGLGASSPNYLTFVPLINRDDVVGLIEFASFKPLSETFEKALKQLADKIGEVLVKMVKK